MMKMLETRASLKFSAVLLCLAAILIIAKAPAGAQGEIVVNANCSLADAIIAANVDHAVGGCLAGDGDDVIIMQGDSVLMAVARVSTSVTIQGGGRSVSGAGDNRLFIVEESGHLRLEDLTLSGGGAQAGSPSCLPDADWTWPELVGGAICNRGILDISASNFSDNSAKYGGAIYNNGELSVSVSEFSGNSGRDSGGAIFNDDEGHVSVSGSEFSDNSAVRTFGGAIYNNGELSVSGSEFSGNSAGNGGAIYNNGELSVSDSEFSGNSAQWGAAITNNGELSVSGSEFSGNSAEYAGGAIINGGEASVSDSEFNGNRAGTSGGAIFNDDEGHVSVSGGVFSDNSPQDCFGLVCQSAPVDSAQEASDNVQEAVPEAAGIIVDGDCSLADAIKAANEDRAVGGCAAGDGADSIIMQRNSVLRAVAQVSTSVTIQGGGLSVSGGGNNRLFIIEESGHLRLEDLTLSGGRAPDGSAEIASLSRIGQNVSAGRSAIGASSTSSVAVSSATAARIERRRDLQRG